MSQPLFGVGVERAMRNFRVNWAKLKIVVPGTTNSTTTSRRIGGPWHSCLQSYKQNCAGDVVARSCYKVIIKTRKMQCCWLLFIRMSMNWRSRLR